MAESKSSGAKCPFGHGTSDTTTSASMPADHPAVTADKVADTSVTPTGSGRCPVMHGGAKPEGAKPSSGRCPVLHARAQQAAAATGDAESKQSVDVHSFAAVTEAPGAIKQHFASSYNQVSLRGAAAPSKAQVALSRRSQAKIGYTEADLDIAGSDVVLMQGVGNPHMYAQYKTGDVVLDLGCGMGVDTRIAARRVGDTGRAIGIDLSEGEVMVAMSRAREQGVHNVDYRVADMEALPLPDASVDVVISNGGFCLVPNKDKAFREIYRVLRPGGRISIACTVRKQILDAGVRWPVCMNTFMLLADVNPVLDPIGYQNVEVDTSNSRMDAQAVQEDDIEAAAKAAGVCTHAIRAQLKRQKKAHGTAATSGDGDAATDAGDAAVGQKVTVHKGESQFSHLRNYNMSDLCARVVIQAVKPGVPAVSTASSAVPQPLWFVAAGVALAAVAGMVYMRAARR